MRNDSLGLVIHSVHRPKLLRQLLKSIDEQIDSDFRVLLVNNGGTPETAEVMRGFALTTERSTSFVDQEENLPFDLVQAADFASVVCFIGDDDILMPHYTKSMRALMREQPEASMYCFGAATMSSRGIPMGFGYYPFRRMQPPYCQQLGMQLADCSLVFETTGVRLIKVAQNDLEISAFDYVIDWWLELLVLLNGEAAISHEKIYRKRLHRRQVSVVADSSAFQRQRIAMMHRLVSTKSFMTFRDVHPSAARLSTADGLVSQAVHRGGLQESDFIALEALLAEQISANPVGEFDSGGGSTGSSRIRTVEPADFVETEVPLFQELLDILKFTVPETKRRLLAHLPITRRRP